MWTQKTSRNFTFSIQQPHRHVKSSIPAWTWCQPAHSGRNFHRGNSDMLWLRPFYSIPYVQRIMTSRHRRIQFPSRNSRHSVGSSLVKQQKAISEIIFREKSSDLSKITFAHQKIGGKLLTWIIYECLFPTFLSTSLNISEIVLKLIKNKNSRTIESPVEWNFL